MISEKKGPATQSNAFDQFPPNETKKQPERDVCLSTASTRQIRAHAHNNCNKGAIVGRLCNTVLPCTVCDVDLRPIFHLSFLASGAKTTCKRQTRDDCSERRGHNEPSAVKYRGRNKLRVRCPAHSAVRGTKRGKSVLHWTNHRRRKAYSMARSVLSFPGLLP